MAQGKIKVLVGIDQRSTFLNRKFNYRSQLRYIIKQQEHLFESSGVKF